SAGEIHPRPAELCAAGHPRFHDRRSLEGSVVGGGSDLEAERRDGSKSLPNTTSRPGWWGSGFAASLYCRLAHSAHGRGLQSFLITSLRQLQAPSRTEREHAVFAGVVRWRAIRSSSRKASARPVSPSFTELKSNAMQRSSNGAGRTGSNVLGAMVLITASSPAARGVYSSATRVASRLLSKRERSSLQASCRCASGSRRSTWSRN